VTIENNDILVNNCDLAISEQCLNQCLAMLKDTLPNWITNATDCYPENSAEKSHHYQNKRIYDISSYPSQEYESASIVEAITEKFQNKIIPPLKNEFYNTEYSTKPHLFMWYDPSTVCYFNKKAIDKLLKSYPANVRNEFFKNFNLGKARSAHNAPGIKTWKYNSIEARSIKLMGGLGGMRLFGYQETSALDNKEDAVALYDISHFGKH